MKIKVIDFGYEQLPKRAHENDAGADIYAHIKGCEDQSGEMIIYPNQTVKIPLGFGLEIPDGYAAFIYPRSSLAAKGIVCELPPIDSGYRGEICAIVTNNGCTPYTIHDGFRIGQIVVTPIVIVDFITEDIEERGTGGFGSTGA